MPCLERSLLSGACGEASTHSFEFDVQTTFVKGIVLVIADLDNSSRSWGLCCTFALVSNSLLILIIDHHSHAITLVFMPSDL